MISARSVSSLRRGNITCVSGSPKRTLYSNTFGPSDVNIRPVNSRPTNGNPTSATSTTISTFFPHAINRGLQNGPLYLREQLWGGNGGRSIAAHSASVRPFVAIKYPLMILCRRQCQDRVTIAKCKDADLISLETLLYDHLVPWKSAYPERTIACRTECFIDHDVSKRLLCLFLGCWNDDPFPGS